MKGYDFHTHPVLVREMTARHPELVAAAREQFYIGNTFQPLETFHLELDAAGLGKAVILPIDATTSRGYRVYSNEQIADHMPLGSKIRPRAGAAHRSRQGSRFPVFMCWNSKHGI